jgi:hypothetical protein
MNLLTPSNDQGCRLVDFALFQKLAQNPSLVAAFVKEVLRFNVQPSNPFSIPP